ncbi:MAG: S-methyl-5-thioribose-1-phosphate isomerase [Methanophagales archaeon ANME-1-THS]|nr:MAG: S-methyl-5-thioribose-1-phosphate isomerase [Methanophagales archaeon ANME-1-THS]
MRTIDWDDEKGVVKLIDQTLLPVTYTIVDCSHLDELIDAIKRLKVRGAPALGVAGAFGVVLACMHVHTETELDAEIERLIHARPTAINLSFGVERALQATIHGRTMHEKVRFALEEAKRIAEEDVLVNRKIGEYGSELLDDGDVVLTHCNAGRLACVDWGTALGVVRTAIEQGKRIEVIACETRPLNQGSRLTTWELLQDKIPVTLITDSMGAAVMRDGKVDMVLVGADRVVKEGIFNKIGTYMHAVVAKAHQIPFYVAAPLSSFDIKRSYKEVVIEERSPDELLFCGEKQIAPLDVKVYNPAFDFTPFELIDAVITEKGVVRPPDLNIHT